jgi:hypothetical protein
MPGSGESRLAGRHAMRLLASPTVDRVVVGDTANLSLEHHSKGRNWTEGFRTRHRMIPGVVHDLACGNSIHGSMQVLCSLRCRLILL